VLRGWNKRCAAPQLVTVDLLGATCWRLTVIERYPAPIVRPGARDRALPPRLFAYHTAVATAGFYELTRNWTIAAHLAAVLGRAMLLINLGPAALGHDADVFSSLLVQDDPRRFAHRTWDEVLEDAAPVVPWLAAYVRCVGLPVAPTGFSARRGSGGAPAPPLLRQNPPLAR
jgi:hypothetical protein